MRGAEARAARARGWPRPTVTKTRTEMVGELRLKENVGADCRRRILR